MAGVIPPSGDYYNNQFAQLWAALTVNFGFMFLQATPI